MFILAHHTPIAQIGKVILEETEGHISRLSFVYDSDSIIQTTHPENAATPLLIEAAKQLDAYLSGKLKTFSLPLKPSGTPFMKEIWQLLLEIPYGETLTYKDIAIKAGRPNTARAVGHACNRNPIPIFIPCHRVIGTNNSLTGYAGGLPLKKYLLQLEGNN